MTERKKRGIPGRIYRESSLRNSGISRNVLFLPVDLDRYERKCATDERKITEVIRLLLDEWEQGCITLPPKETDAET